MPRGSLPSGLQPPAPTARRGARLASRTSRCFPLRSHLRSDGARRGPQPQLPDPDGPSPRGRAAAARRPPHERARCAAPRGSLTPSARRPHRRRPPRRYLAPAPRPLTSRWGRRGAGTGAAAPLPSPRSPSPPSPRTRSLAAQLLKAFFQPGPAHRPRGARRRSHLLRVATAPRSSSSLPGPPLAPPPFPSDVLPLRGALNSADGSGRAGAARGALPSRPLRGLGAAGGGRPRAPPRAPPPRAPGVSKPAGAPAAEMARIGWGFLLCAWALLSPALAAAEKGRLRRITYVLHPGQAGSAAGRQQQRPALLAGQQQQQRTFNVQLNARYGTAERTRRMSKAGGAGVQLRLGPVGQSHSNSAASFSKPARFGPRPKPPPGPHGNSSGAPPRQKHPLPPLPG